MKEAHPLIIIIMWLTGKQKVYKPYATHMVYTL